MRTQLVERRRELTLSQEQLAQRVGPKGVSVRTIKRWEKGGGVRLDQRQAYADALEWPLSRLLIALAGDGRPGPINGHRVTRLGHLVSLEQAAADLWTFEPTVVPGLLQTEEYAAVVESVAPDLPSADEVARRVGQRIRRQQVLHGEEPLCLSALIDASVLMRTTGSSDILYRQLDHLRAMNDRPNVDVRVLPLDERAHAAGRGAFMLLTSHDSELPFMAVVENAAGVQYFDSEAAVTAHVELWAHLWSVSDGLA